MIRFTTIAALAGAFAMSVAWADAPPKIILLVGPPGSGKTTQAKLLSKKYGIPAFSMADLLKKEMTSGKKNPALAAAMASGDLLPDEQANNLIRLRMFSADLRKGFILDGYPSTAAQAKSLDAMLAEQQLPRAVAVVLDAPDDVIRKRMMARKRVDDKPEIIDRRIKEFRAEAAMLIGWVGETRIVRVDGAKSIPEVSTQIVAGLEDFWSKVPTFKQRQ
jgi:adenylate kinase